MTDKMWEEFMAWWKSQWSEAIPNRLHITLYEQWYANKLRKVSWGWKKRRKNES